MKKLTVVFMALMLCLQAFSGTVVLGAETGDNIGGLTATANPQPDYVGYYFGLKIEFTNKSDSTLEDLTVSVDEKSDFTTSMPEPTKLGSLTRGSSYAGTEPVLVIAQKAAGRNVLILNFTYTIGGKEYKESEAAAVDVSSSKPLPPDTSKPKIEYTGSRSIPTIQAGTSKRMYFAIKNNSTYEARNVEISLKMTDETKAPLILDNFDMRQSMDKIGASESKDFYFDVSVLSGAPEGLYTLKLSCDYENSSGDSSYNTSQTLYFRVSNDNVSPKLTVYSVSVRPDEQSKDSILLFMYLKNLGKEAAKDVKVTLQGLESKGFTTYNSTNIRYVNSINGGSSAPVSYQLLPPASGAADSNELSIKLDYRDASGNTYSEVNQIFVPVGEGEGSRPEISFEKIVSPQAALTTGEDFTVGLDLKNGGGAAARNIKVSLTADAALIIKTMNPVYLDTLGANSTKNLSFKLFAADDAATKNYPIAINVEYEDAYGNKYTATQYIGAYVEGSGSSKSVPRIIVNNYTMDPFPVNAGEDFKLKMSFLNTSKTTDVSNIKVTVASDDGTFTPTDSGNTFYIEGIPSKQNVERELLLHVKPDAEQKSYMLTVDFEYEDDKGNPFTAKETMSVRVLQNPRLVTGDLNLAPEAYVGQPVQFYLDFYNMGKSTLYNLMVKLEGEFDGQNLSYYVGNFEPGRTDFFDVSAMPRTAGQQNGSILFTFEDANGKKVEVRKEFSLNVMEMAAQGPMVDPNGMPIGKDGMVIGPDGKPVNGSKLAGLSIWIYIGAGAGLLVVAAVVFLILRRRHIRRKEMSLDE